MYLFLKYQYLDPSNSKQYISKDYESAQITVHKLIQHSVSQKKRYNYKIHRQSVSFITSKQFHQQNLELKVRILWNNDYLMQFI